MRLRGFKKRRPPNLSVVVITQYLHPVLVIFSVRDVIRRRADYISLTEQRFAGIQFKVNRDRDAEIGHQFLCRTDRNA